MGVSPKTLWLTSKIWNWQQKASSFKTIWPPGHSQSRFQCANKYLFTISGGFYEFVVPASSFIWAGNLSGNLSPQDSFQDINLTVLLAFFVAGHRAQGTGVYSHFRWILRNFGASLIINPHWARNLSGNFSPQDSFQEIDLTVLLHPGRKICLAICQVFDGSVGLFWGRALGTGYRCLFQFQVDSKKFWCKPHHWSIHPGRKICLALGTGSK